MIYGVLNGCGQQLSFEEFKRSLARLAVGEADEDEDVRPQAQTDDPAATPPSRPTRPSAAAQGPPRPTEAHRGPLRPIEAHRGPPRPTDLGLQGVAVAPRPTAAPRSAPRLARQAARAATGPPECRRLGCLPAQQPTPPHPPVLATQDPLTPLLLLLPDRIEQIKLTSLDVQRRFKVLTACDMLIALLDDDDLPANA